MNEILKGLVQNFVVFLIVSASSAGVATYIATEQNSVKISDMKSDIKEIKQDLKDIRRDIYRPITAK